MEISARELWTVVHGMTLGALFLLAFASGLAGLYSLRPAWVTVEGLKERLSRLKIGMWVMAAVAWATDRAATWAFVMLGAGLVATLHPFFELFASE